MTKQTLFQIPYGKYLKTEKHYAAHAKWNIAKKHINASILSTFYTLNKIQSNQEYEQLGGAGGKLLHFIFSFIRDTKVKINLAHKIKSTDLTICDILCLPVVLYL